MFMFDTNFNTIDAGKEKLKEAVRLRNRMGGAVFSNALLDDCVAIADKLRALGADNDEIIAILNG